MGWPDLAAEVLDACIETFAIDTTYTPPSGSPAAVRGVFDRPSQDVAFALGGGELPMAVASFRPTLGVKLASLPGGVAVRGATVGPIGGLTFKVAEIVEDGQGGASLVLERA